MPDLDALVPAGETPRRRAREGLGLDPETMRLRRLEITWRATNAARIAAEALRRLHDEDYESLRHQARARLDAERGPLPGDPT